MTKTAASIPNLNARDAHKIVAEFAAEAFAPSLRELAANERIFRRAAMHTAAAQVEDYDKHASVAWRETFTRLSRPASNLNGNGADETIAMQRFFDAIPNCHFKRFQEAFCPPDRMVVPIAAIERKDGKTFPKNSFRWDEMSVAGCLPRADFIPDELALKLGLLTAKEYDLSPEDRLNAKGHLSQINKLKLIWDRLVPLSPDIRSDAEARIRRRDLRALRVGSDDCSRNVVLEHQDGIESLVGTVLYVQGLSGVPAINRLGPREIHKKIVLFYGDIYSARRRAGHEAINAATETEQLADIQGALVSTSNRVSRGWTKPMTDDLRKMYADDVADVSGRAVRALGVPRDDLKVSAQQHATRIKDSKDRSGKLNPAVTANGLATANKRLGARRERVSRISSWNRIDGLHLSGTIHEQEGVMRDMHARLLQTAGELSQRSALFGARPLSDRMMEIQVKTYREKLGFSVEPLSRLTVRPFITFARALEMKFDEFESVCVARADDGAERLKNARRVVNEVETIFRVYQALRLVEHIRQEADIQPPPLLREMASKIDHVIKHLDRPLLFPRASVRPVVLSVVANECEIVRTLLPSDISDRYTADDRSKILKDAKTAINALDVETIFAKARTT